MEFIPVFLPGDINAYSMARAFHEEYGITSISIGKQRQKATNNSKIVEFREIPDITNPEVFLRVVNALPDEFPGKKFFLIGCGDSYVRLIIENRDQLRDEFIVPYIDEDLLNTLSLKESFYKLCDKYGLDHPETLILTPDNRELNVDWSFPIIIKPSDSVKYGKVSFPGKYKVFTATSMEHARDIVERTFGAGYDAGLIVQEFIPGNDANMRVLTAYSDRNKKVKLMSLGHVLLEEHTPSGIGNHAVILNDYDAELMAQVKNFLEGVGYTGFSNFDIKYDPRDQEFKFFEVNIRQGRSNYYVTGAGNNLAKYLADDYIYHKDIPLKMAKERALWAAIPIRLALRYFDGSLKEEMKSLIKQGKFTHSVWYNKDRGLVRFVKTLLSQINHIRKYRKYYPVHAHKAAN